MADRLDEMFDAKQAFMQRTGIPQGGPRMIGLDHLAYWHDKLADAIIMEGSELKDWGPWKHWSSRSGNKQVAREDMYSGDHIELIVEELADLLCFIIELSLLLGYDADALFMVFMEKERVNHERQDKGGY